MADIASFRALVEQYSKVSYNCTEAELDEVYRLCCALSAVLEARTMQMLETDKDRCLMSCYMSDGWGKKVRTVSTAAADGVKVVREGRFKHEFLLERSMLRGFSGTGAPIMSMGFGPPMGMCNGRGSWNIMNAASQFSPALRSLGHDGLSITVYLQDGALFESTFRKWLGLHEVMYHPEHGFVEADDRYRLKNSDFVVGVLCCIHCGHNAVDWSLKPLKPDQTSDNAYIALNCLCQCSTLFHSRVDKFLRRFVYFEDRTDPPFAVRAFWAALDLQGPVLELFVDVDPWWDQERQVLLVRSRLQHDVACWDKLQVVLLTCRRWCTWSETRWCTLGRAARLFVRSACTGVDAAYKQLVDDPLCSAANLAGFRYIDPTVRKLFAVAAIGTIPGEAFVREMLKDDRLLRNSGLYLDAVHRHMRSHALLPDLVWARVAAMCGMTADDYKHEVIVCFCVSFGYLHRTVFRDLSYQPLSLTQNDIEANVAALAENRIVAEDERVHRMKRLLDAGVPQEALVQALMLLRECPMSTKMVEEAHASGALMMREHSRYSEKALRVRALLHQMRSITRAPPLSKEQRFLEKRMQKNNRYQPSRLRGRHMYCRRRVRQQLEDAGRGSLERLCAARQGMATFSAEFVALGPLEQLAYEQDAADYAEQMQAQKNRIDIETQAAMIQLRDRMRQAAEDRGLTNHNASVRLSEAELQAACDIFNSEEIQALRLEQHYGAFGRGPTVPLASEQKVIEDCAEGVNINPSRRGRVPEWCRQIARIREQFVGCAIGFAEEGHEWWLVLFCKANPHECNFLMLHEREQVVDLADPEQAAEPEARRTYDWFPPTTRTELDIPWPAQEPDPEIFVRCGVRARGLFMTSPHAAMPFDRFLLIHTMHHVSTPAAPAGEAGVKRLKKDIRQDLLDANPWLSDDDLPGGQMPSKRRRADRAAPPAHTADASAEDLPDYDSDDDGDGHAPAAGDGEDTGAHADDGAAALAEVAGAFEELAEIRDALSRYNAVDLLYFYTRVRGGRWTKLHKNKAADECTGLARGGWPKWWCDRFQFPLQKSFSFSTYGEESACALALEFCTRAEFFYNIWLESHDSEYDFVYEQHHLDAYSEGLEYLNLVLELSDEDPVFLAGADLRTLFPELGALLD